MLRVKSVVTLKANPGILKCSGRIKMQIWLCVERGSYLEFGNRVAMRKIGRNIVTVNRAMDQEAQEAEEKVDSCRDGHELFRMAKQRAGEKRDVVGVSCLKVACVVNLKLAFTD